MSAREEIFGPVAGLIPFTTEEDAIEIANDTPYGLAAAIWTTNLHRTQRMVQAVRAGTVWVNCYRRVSYAAPFGGGKASGLGHENGLEVTSGSHLFAPGRPETMRQPARGGRRQVNGGCGRAPYGLAPTQARAGAR